MAAPSKARSLADIRFKDVVPAILTGNGAFSSGCFRQNAGVIVRLVAPHPQEGTRRTLETPVPPTVGTEQAPVAFLLMDDAEFGFPPQYGHVFRAGSRALQAGCSLCGP